MQVFITPLGNGTGNQGVRVQVARQSVVSHHSVVRWIASGLQARPYPPLSRLLNGSFGVVGSGVPALGQGLVINSRCRSSLDGACVRFHTRERNRDMRLT